MSHWELGCDTAVCMQMVAAMSFSGQATKDASLHVAESLRNLLAQGLAAGPICWTPCSFGLSNKAKHGAAHSNVFFMQFFVWRSPMLVAVVALTTSLTACARMQIE